MFISEKFFMLATCTFMKGGSVQFSKDLWDDYVLLWKFPQLFSFVRNEKVSVIIIKIGRAPLLFPKKSVIYLIGGVVRVDSLSCAII